MSDDEILRADPGHRARVLGLAFAAALAGLVGLFFLRAELRGLPELLATSPEEGARRFLFLSRLVFGLMAAGFAGMAFYLLRLSWRSLASGAFPPPGTRVLRDTLVLRGAAARTRAKVGLGLGLAVLLFGLFVPHRAHRNFVHFVAGELDRMNTVPRELYRG